MPSSSELLDRFAQYRSQIDNRQVLAPAYFAFLERLGSPHLHLPPIFHVAGTNGKGSTCAFLRAILEAAGYKVHVYTSPHLVRFHERIRIAGTLISEEEFVELLTLCHGQDREAQVSTFEALTAAAFVAFARHPADFVILETGLGGRLDATNVVPKKLAALVTRLSFDHREFLGDTLEKIAGEKAGIMREDVPCFTAAQPYQESIDALKKAAAKIHAPLIVGGENWYVKMRSDGFHFHDDGREFDLPMPALSGAHQIENAGLAIAALSVLPKRISRDEIAQGLAKVEWPARLQQLKTGLFAQFAQPNAELWLDGGHNDSAGEVLAAQAQKWVEQDGSEPRSLHLIYGMLMTKKPQEFLQSLLPYTTGVQTLTIPDQDVSFSAADLAKAVRDCGIKNVREAPTVQDAIQKIIRQSPRARILICGSLYLAGHVLAENNHVG